MASLEDTQQLIQGAELLAAGRALGLTDDETIETKRATIRRNIEQRRDRREGNTLYLDDPVIQELDAEARALQKDKPIRDADLLGMAEYGSNEADLQQVSAGRVESLQAQDASGIGDDERGAKKFNRARRDLLPQRVGAFVETPSGKRIYVQGVNQPGQRVSDELKEATILQELGLGNADRVQVPYKTTKSGQRRRNFGYVQKDASGEVIKERMSRVKRQRPAGQAQNPEDIISTDKYKTARRNRERGIGDDGPTGVTTERMTTKNPIKDAYVRLVTAVQNGEVSLDDPVNFSQPYSGVGPAQTNTRTVRDVLVRLEDSIGERGKTELMRNESRNLRIQDQQANRKRAARQLREFAILAKNEGNPLSKAEAMELSQRLLAPKGVSDLRAKRKALQYAGREYGSTDEVIGETVMSDDAWKAKSTRQIPALPIKPQADIISDMQVFQRVNPAGEVVGHSAGGHFIGEANVPTTLQNLNVPDNQRSLVNFISDNLQYDDKGGLKPAIITTATRDFTDAVRGLSSAAFGEGVNLIPEGIQSLGEAQRFVDRLIERRQETGKGFSRYNPENPSKPLTVPAGETPTVSDLMSTMRVDKSTQGRLANALYSMALAEASQVNQEGKQRYGAREGSYQRVYRPQGQSGSVNLDLQAQGTPAVDLPRENITFDSPAGVFYDGAQPQFITNQQKASIDGKSINIQPALARLSDPLAREPFIGAVAGEGERPKTFRKGFGQDVSLEEGYTQMHRDRATRKRPYSQKRVDFDIARARGVEDRFNRSMGDKRAVELGRQAQSAAFDDAVQEERQADNRLADQRRRETLAALAGQGPQRTRPSQVAPSIALDSGVPTGGQERPIADAGGPLAIIQKERAARKPQASQYYDGSSKYDVASTFSESRRPKSKPASEKGTSQQLRDRINNIITSATGVDPRNRPTAKEFATDPKYRRGRIGAGLGALAGVLGLSSIGREEEEQV